MTALPDTSLPLAPHGDSRPLCFTVLVVDQMLDTASQRPATGLDSGARFLIVRAVEPQPSAVLGKFFHERLFAGWEDYVSAVMDVWGLAAGNLCAQAVHQGIGTARNRDLTPMDAAALDLLLAMPEPDFRSAIHGYVPDMVLHLSISDRITEICKGRGTPWTYSWHRGWEWVGDEDVEATVVRPALSAIGDRRFAGGVKSHFDSARSELALGTPTALSQSVHQSGCSVESAMKVVLDERGVTYDAKKDTAYTLFGHLKSAGIVPPEMEYVVLATMTPRNRWGGHGAGSVAHAVTQEEAEAVFASTAVSIAYLHKLLP